MHRSRIIIHRLLIGFPPWQVCAPRAAKFARWHTAAFGQRVDIPAVLGGIRRKRIRSILLHPFSHCAKIGRVADIGQISLYQTTAAGLFPRAAAQLLNKQDPRIPAGRMQYSKRPNLRRIPTDCSGQDGGTLRSHSPKRRDFHGSFQRVAATTPGQTTPRSRPLRQVG